MFESLLKALQSRPKDSLKSWVQNDDMNFVVTRPRDCNLLITKKTFFRSFMFGREEFILLKLEYVTIDGTMPLSMSLKVADESGYYVNDFMFELLQMSVSE